MSINTATERPGALRQGQQGRLGVPWSTVVALAVVMAYADGFWLTSLRGAVGAIERTQEPFASWLRESTLMLPVFVLAVLGALTLALRWFGPALRGPRTVAATVLLVVVAGTLVGIAATVASSAYDYHLQSLQLQMMDSMRTTCASGSCLAQEQRASLGLQVHAVGIGSGILLVTNLVLVAWVVAMMGGRLKVGSTRRQPDGPTDTQLMTGSSRVNDIRLLLVAALVASAAIHTAVVPEHLTEWGTAGLFFIVLTAAELAVAGLLLSRVQPRTVLLAAVAVSIVPLVLWLYSRTLGMPFGPESGVPEQIGLADCVACAMEAGSLLAAVVLLRGSGWLRRPAASAHVRGLIVVALIAVTVIGVAGAGLSWFDVFGIPGGQPVMDMSH